MMWFEKILRNTAFGCFLGATIALLFAWLIDSDLSYEIKRLYTFVLTALTSLLAATLTLFGVFTNIENQRHVEERQRRRKLEAAKALLPSALSKVCGVCRWGIRYSHSFESYKTDLGPEEFERLSSSQLSLSDEVISVFRDMIELSDDEKVADRLAGLLREHQVFFARWQSEFSPDADNRVVTENNIRERTVGWAYLYAIASSLFAYARNEEKTITSAVENFNTSSALYQAGIADLFTEDFTFEVSTYSTLFKKRFL